MKKVFMALAIIATFGLTSCHSYSYSRTERTTYGEAVPVTREYQKCSVCKGLGGCTSCKGTGKISGSTCATCKGTGKCQACNGKGVL